jgi:hypothetical protein
MATGRIIESIEPMDLANMRANGVRSLAESPDRPFVGKRSLTGFGDRDDRRRRAAELAGAAAAGKPHRQAVARSMSRSPKKPAPEPAAPGKQYRWAIYHITGTPAKLLGHVEAIDEESAIKQAIEEFGITNPQLQKRLLAQRRP